MERFKHRILAFCLMTNHVHLAVQVADFPLSRILQNLAFRYTRWINWRRKRSGHLFQGRYKAFVVEAEPYLVELTAYIHLNPVRAGIVKDAGAYRWSSHRAYSGKELLPWLETDFILGQFSKNLVKARKAFSEFVEGKSGEGHREEFHGKTSTDSRFIGDDGFVDDVLRQEESLPCRKPDLTSILATVKRMYGLGDDDMAAPGQKRIPSEARMMAAWAVREFSDSTLAELAQATGRDASTMSAAAARFDTRRGKEKELAVKTEKLKEELEVSIIQA